MDRSLRARPAVASEKPVTTSRPVRAPETASTTDKTGVEADFTALENAGFRAIRNRLAKRTRKLS